MPIPIDVFLWFLSKMPTLRFKIILSKKKEESTLADTHLSDLKRIIAKLFNRFVNSDLLPYMMAPLAFLALMYLEWLYLTMLWCAFWSTGSRSEPPKLLVMSCSFRPAKTGTIATSFVTIQRKKQQKVLDRFFEQKSQISMFWETSRRIHQIASQQSTGRQNKLIYTRDNR